MTKPTTAEAFDQYIFRWAGGFFVHCLIEAVKIENLFNKPVIMYQDELAVRLKFSDAANAVEFVSRTLNDGDGVYPARPPSE